MESPVTAHHYIDPDVTAREQARLFRKLWIFAGFKSAVATPNAFFTRKIGDVPVVIQNMEGTIRAFENLCAHRQMAMQTEAFGKRPMVCKYHAWAYDALGKLRAMGNDFLYELTPEEKADAHLKPFALVEVGNMLFVNLAENPMPIEEQFTPEYLKSLHEMSLHLDDEFIYSSFIKNHNWKLNFENVLDYNHIPFIHSQSFLPLIKLSMNSTPAARVIPDDTRAIKATLDANMPVSLSELSYAAGSPLEIEPLWYQKEVERYGDQNRYYSWFTYPNVNIGSVYGTMFLFQQYMPVGPDRLEYHLWVMTAKKKNKKANFAALLWGLIKAEKKVIDEDAIALEALQSSLHAEAPSYKHGVYEAHIVRMLRWYANRINADEKSPQPVTLPGRHEKTSRYG